MITVTYHIDTGEKQEYYTLWKEITLDYRPLDESGKPYHPENYVNKFGKSMLYFKHWYFVQNLAKTKEDAIAKCSELGIEVDEKEFEFNLAHRSKPSVFAFGAKMSFKKEKWYSKATKEFFEVWRNNKDEMKSLGWSCSKFQNVWYMFYKPNLE